MGDVGELLEALAAAGVTLRLGGPTGLTAEPASALTAEQRAVIAANRAEVMERLRNEEAADAAIEAGHLPFPPGHEGPAVLLAGYLRLGGGWVPAQAPEPLPGSGGR